MARSKRTAALSHLTKSWACGEGSVLGTLHERAADALWTQADALDARAAGRAFHEGRAA